MLKSLDQKCLMIIVFVSTQLVGGKKQNKQTKESSLICFTIPAQAFDEQETQNSMLARNLQDCEDGIVERNDKISELLAEVEQLKAEVIGCQEQKDGILEQSNKMVDLQKEVQRLKAEVAGYEQKAMHQDKIASGLSECVQRNQDLQNQLQEGGVDADGRKCQCQSEQEKIAELQNEVREAKAKMDKCEEVKYTIPQDVS